MIHHLAPDGANLFAARVVNIQIDEAFVTVDMEHIDASVIRPVIYSPYQYYGAGEKLDEMGEWKPYVKAPGNTEA